MLRRYRRAFHTPDSNENPTVKELDDDELAGEYASEVFREMLRYMRDSNRVDINTLNAPSSWQRRNGITEMLEGVFSFAAMKNLREMIDERLRFIQVYLS